MKKFTLLISLLIPVLLFSGCSRKFHLKSDMMANPSPWPYYRNNLNGNGEVASKGFRGNLNLIWEQKTNGKPIGPLTLNYDVLVLPDSKKKFKFYRISDGKYLGKLKNKGMAKTGMIIKDSLGLYSLAARYNQLVCVDLRHNKILWKRYIKDAAPGSIIINNSLIIGSADGNLYAINLADGRTDWNFKVAGNISSPVTFANGQYLQADDLGNIYMISEDSREEKLRIKVDGPVENAVVYDRLIYTADILGNVYGIDPANGKIIWQTALNHPVWTAPVLADSRLYIGNSGGEVVALDPESGARLWTYSLDEVIEASPLAIGHYLVAGTKTGRLLVLDGTSGKLVSETDLKGAISFAPVSDGRRVYVATDKGKIYCLGEVNESSQDRQRSDSQN